MLVAYAGNAISQSFAKLNYSLEKDFDAVTQIGSLPLTVHPSLPVKNVKEFVALIKARPKQLYYASPGNGSLPHLAAELFKSQAAVEIMHVPYKNNPQVITDLIGGQIAMTFAAPLPVLPHAKAGRLRLIAISSAERSAVAPEVPTIAEAGLAGFDVGQRYGVLAPTGASREIIARLNKEIANIIRMPDIRDKLASGGVDTATGTQQDVAVSIKSEIAKWAKAVKASGARVD